MNKIGLIIWREFITRVRKASFLIMTILTPVLIAGGLVLAVYIGLQGSEHQHVLVEDPNHVIDIKLRDTDDVSFFVDNSAWSDSAFLKSHFTVWVRFTDEITYPTAELWYKDRPGFNATRSITNELEKAIELAKLDREGIDEEAYRRVRRPLTISMFDIDQGGVESLDQERAGIGFFFGYFMFIFIFLYGVQVMRGVMEEKQNRVVEVLISSVKPFQLMMGKIVGVAMVGLTQFLLWGFLSLLLGFIGLGLAKDSISASAMQEATPQMTTQIQEQMGAGSAQFKADSDSAEQLGVMLEIWNELPVTWILLLFLFYFLGGYLLYSSLFAAMGAAVDSETDTQQFMLPITVPMIIAVFIAQTAVYNPDGPAVFWCSIIPFTAPVVMMVRIATGNAFAHPGELALSMVLLVATFIFTTWLAGRIYRTGILMYGKKVTWKELGKWLFYKG